MNTSPAPRRDSIARTHDQAHGQADGQNWRPTADLAALRLRAETLARIRGFFGERGVLEVSTPLLATTTATDPHLASMEVHCPTCPARTGAGRAGRLFLQTSPEFFMKRLLAAGSGPIFQIGKAFRAGERGTHHNPEFTLLEWYRPGFDREGLMREVESLVRSLLPIGPARRMTYLDAFQRYAGLDPFRAPLSTLRDHAIRLGATTQDARSFDRDTCLDLISSRIVQPALGQGAVFISHFPASQAAMARLAPHDPLVAERFELFVDGVELANGYHELTDSREQRRRFLADGETRKRMGLAETPLDERLLMALDHGLPDCAGVALGVDRLLMLLSGAADLDAVMAFPFSRV
uniref:Lysyl-tRNA synthetase, class 2 n=1 Tax=Candidatus Kentrum sp. SD TaxID=2126332 RepID=A0A450Y6J1_9GAMM|nr:MAG: lysyl-tRNA synthetase, class 2 [Candidatus Kentron sp. SD]VFK41239.1 MAG: lysyl-tRNA synthetase, class 2 [Candidatus Kentron sp. SD]